MTFLGGQGGNNLASEGAKRPPVRLGKERDKGGAEIERRRFVSKHHYADFPPRLSSSDAVIGCGL